MLQPEQIQITQVAPEVAVKACGLDGQAACCAAVVDADFGSPVSVLSVRLVRTSNAA